jgi:two-component system, NarL family, nitrate/nitrite response regulator NarL
MSIPAVIFCPVSLFRYALAQSIADRTSRLRVTETCADVDGVLDALDSTGAEVVLIDARVSLPEVRRLRARAPAAVFIALGFTATADDEIVGWGESGVTGYLAATAGIDELVDTVERTRRGEMVCSARIAATLARRVEIVASRSSAPDGLYLLTERELDVVRLLQDGLSNKEIALSLRIRTATVKNHVHHILEKLRVRRRGEAVALLRNGGVPPESPGRGSRKRHTTD